MECEPRERELLVRVARPLERVPVPKVLVPSWNVTVPVGVPVLGETGLTVAVKITDWPKTEGWAEEVTAVALVARLTVWVTTSEVLVLKLVSPLKTAVIE